MKPPVYCVNRWGGQERWPARTVIATTDHEKARAKFDKVKKAMRQGRVTLMCDGKEIDVAFAYSNRTRW